MHVLRNLFNADLLPRMLETIVISRLLPFCQGYLRREDCGWEAESFSGK